MNRFRIILTAVVCHLILAGGDVQAQPAPYWRATPYQLVIDGSPLWISTAAELKAIVARLALHKWASEPQLSVEGTWLSFRTMKKLNAYVAKLSDPAPPVPAPDPTPPPHPTPEPNAGPQPHPDLEPDPQPAQPPQPGPTPGWPTVKQLPTTPLSCWTTGQGCYPEPRNFIEAQWHEAPNNNLDQARHIHLGAAFPRVFKGIVRLDLRVVAFHMEGAQFEGIRKALIRVEGHRRLLPEPWKKGKQGLFKTRVTKHLQEFYVPLYLDVTHAANSGTHLLEIDASFRSPDGHDSAIRLQVPIVIDNGKPSVPNKVGAIAVEGWVSDRDGSTPFGYLRLAAPRVRRFVSERVEPMDLYVSGLENRTLSALAAVNPDLHKHPPAYGMVLLDQYVTMDFNARTIEKRVFQPALGVGDRLLFRVGDADPELPPSGAGAVLLVVTIGQD